ncbi:hypothetical protein VNO77_20259 [Canavalia gladiata]|uniref:Uncharacterized protein n=1 Tax=Canavalia gladiata TaxID=3824 RepID=A0AAN9LP44_CANGL
MQRPKKTQLGYARREDDMYGSSTSKGVFYGSIKSGSTTMTITSRIKHWFRIKTSIGCPLRPWLLYIEPYLHVEEFWYGGVHMESSCGLNKNV